MIEVWYNVMLLYPAEVLSVVLLLLVLIIIFGAIKSLFIQKVADCYNMNMIITGRYKSLFQRAFMQCNYFVSFSFSQRTAKKTALFFYVQYHDTAYSSVVNRASNVGVVHTSIYIHVY